MTNAGFILCVVLTAVFIIIAVVELKLAKDVDKVFASLVWMGHFPLPNASESAKTADHICVEHWDFTWAPEHYNIAIELNPSNQTFGGKVIIEGHITETTSSLELNCENLTIFKASLNAVQIQQFFIEGNVLTFKLVQNLERGSKFILKIEYEGVFHETLGVIMKTFRGDSYMIATNLEPVSARRVFPCIDFPRYKATFDVAVKRPEKGLKVLSNMPEKDPSDSESEWVHFHRTPKMSTYLLAFIITDYVPFKVNTSRHQLNTDIKIWVPQKKVHSVAVKWAAALTAELLFHLQNFVGSNFTLPKLDLFSIPPFEENVGGMENWGLIVIREKSLMIKKRSTVSDEMEIIYTITHELAHDWFGNLVTIEDWCSVWIQEALASYLQALIPTQAFSNVDMVKLEKWFARDFVLGQECESTDLRSLNMNKSTNSSSLFDVTDYHKGAVILFMLESVVTRPVFRQALRNFIENNQYGYVTDADLWAAVQDSADANGVQLPSSVRAIMHSWVNQGGHPVVHVSRDENGTVTVKQAFCSATSESSNFWIPLTYTTKSDVNFNDIQTKMWLSGVEPKALLDTILHPNEWIIFNVHNSAELSANGLIGAFTIPNVGPEASYYDVDGVYRVNYDSINWSLLAHQLKRNHSIIHPTNRAILLDDAFHLASVGQISYSVPLRLMEYLVNEDSAYVWNVVHSHIWKLTEDKLAYEELQLLKSYVGTLLDSIYPAVKYWDDYDRELSLFEERKLRGMVYGVANLVNYQPYRKDAVTFIEEVAVHRVNNKTGFCECTPHEVSEHSMWSIALADGSPSLFELRVQHYHQVKDEEIKSSIVHEILHDTSNVTRLLHWLMDIPVDDELWEYYVKVFQDSWPTKCKELEAYVEVHWPKLRDAYDEYRKFMNEYDQEVPPTPINKEAVVYLMQRFLQFPPMFMSMTPTCFELTNQVFNVTKADEDDETKAVNDGSRGVFGNDVVIWLRRHAKKTA